MQPKIVVVGTGFAGLWSALSAKRLLKLRGQESSVDIVVVSPEPTLVVRPRLYEPNASSMIQPLGGLFEAAGIKFVQGTVDTISPEKKSIGIQTSSGDSISLEYTRLILAAGSSLMRPQSVRGIDEYTFDVDSLHGATKLEAHIKGLSSLPASPSRDTVVVCGCGFTGIELATELPARLKHIPNARVVLIEGSLEVGSTLGAGPRPVITEALKELGIEVKLGSRVASVDAEGVTLTSGERIDTLTAAWTAGMRATGLTQQLPGTKDSMGRVHVDQDLRVPDAKDVFVTGDAAHVYADAEGGHLALMSCQHAQILGRVAGYNAAADLLGEAAMPYTQPDYACCLDLGAKGAVIGNGWTRDVMFQGDLAKRVKLYINHTLIYAPVDIDEAIALADPVQPGSDELFAKIVEAVK